MTAARPISRQSKTLRGNDKVVGFIADTSQPADDGAGGDHGFVEGDLAEWPEGPISTVHMTVRSIDDPSEDIGDTPPT